MLKPRCEKRVMRHKAAFRDALVEWFGAEGKDYPWRGTRDPYAVLVSEVMLQQTRIATVLERGFYVRFLEKFPTVEDLADADDADLLKAWEGLGYYRRARMLRDTARAVVERHGGVFPQGEDELLALPGVGRYTVGALRAFAFGLPSVLVDGNVVRVLSRVMDDGGDVHSAQGMKRMWQVAADLADDERPHAYHSALMELGQTHCRKRSPECLRCPVSFCCATRDPDGVPVMKARVKVEEVEEFAIWMVDRKGRVLLHQEQGSRRTGLWKLPLRKAEDVVGLREMFSLTYGITRYRVTLRVHEVAEGMGSKPMGDGDAWVAREDVAGLAMAAPFRKALDRLLLESH